VAVSDRALRQAVAEIVGAGPLTRAAIEAELGARGLPVGQRLDAVLRDDATLAQVKDGFVHVPTLFDGTAWTVWVDGEDAQEGFIYLEPGLGPLAWWLVAADDVPLVDETGARQGSLVTDDLDGADILVGPDGWLAELAGGWATVRVIDGGLRWTAGDAAPDPTAAQIAAMRSGFRAALSTRPADGAGPIAPADLPYAIDDATVYEAVVADRPVFLDDPIPPLPALFEAAGLEVQGSIVAERGFDWEALRTWQDRNRLGLLYGLDDEAIDLLIPCLGATLAWLDDGDEGLGATDDERHHAAASVAALLEDGELAAAYGDECERRDLPWTDVVRFVESLDARLDGPTPIGFAWIRARGLDLAGDVAGAIAVLEHALTASGDHEPALVELAGFYADRGDAAKAFALLHRAGVTEPADEDEYGEADEAELLFAEVGWFAQHRPRPAAGRNDRCPCGSGRKYKACHLGRERHPLDDRAGWLFEKAHPFLRRRAPDTIDELAGEMIDAMDDWSPWRELRASPWLADLALHEGGVFAEFLAARDALLPEDEAMLAAQWMLVPRGVFEIRRAQGENIDLHDIGRGDDITVRNVTPSERMRKGTVVVGRPLPVGDTFRAFGGLIEVPRARVSDVLDAIDGGDPLAVVAVIGQTMRPPALQNSEGQELVLHTIRWRCPPAIDVSAALVDAGLEEDPGGARWTLVRDTPGQTRAIIAELRLAGDELTSDVNSDERAAELRALVSATLPDAELVEDVRRTAFEAMQDVDPDELSGPLPLDPDVRAALAGIIAEHERRWLDESIPALGGRTPRQAARDPVGREELEHLLDSFPPALSDDVMVMSAQRLRDALGL